eukprot:1771949-Rhodomonas_salina.3
MDDMSTEGADVNPSTPPFPLPLHLFSGTNLSPSPAFPSFLRSFCAHHWSCFLTRSALARAPLLAVKLLCMSFPCSANNASRQSPES